MSSCTQGNRQPAGDILFCSGSFIRAGSFLNLFMLLLHPLGGIAIRRVCSFVGVFVSMFVVVFVSLHSANGYNGRWAVGSYTTCSETERCEHVHCKIYTYRSGQ